MIKPVRNERSDDTESASFRSVVAERIFFTRGLTQSLGLVRKTPSLFEVDLIQQLDRHAPDDRPSISHEQC